MQEYRGLVNEGSTCYLNSLLQTLFMTPEFRQNVYSYVHDERKISAADSIPYQLQKLFVLLQLNQKAVYSKGLLKSFQWNQVDSFQQHDVQEFCRVLFEALEKASKGSNWIEKMYSGAMESFISCGKHPRANQQIFMDISLPIKNPFTFKCYQSIEECLKEYLRPQTIENVDCEGCGEKVKVEKGMRLLQTPPVLTLQVNRFELNYETMQREKINSFLYFPEILQLWRFMVPFEQIKIKEMPKDLLEKTKLVEKQKSARQTDWGFGGLGIQGKKIERKKSFEVEAQKKQTKFYDEQNRDKRQDETKKLSAEEEKMKNIQILKDLKAEKQKMDKKGEKGSPVKEAKEVKEVKETKPAQKSNLDDDMLFGSFMEGFDISGKSQIENQFGDISVTNQSGKGAGAPKFQKTQAIFQHEQQQFDINKEYPKNTYVLFSILVHSGGAYGGHYYAYIFDGKDWFCFNDNIVRKASRQEIRKYGHPSEETSYGANAYLLFYREASTFRNIINSPIQIPEDLLEKVKNDKAVEPTKLQMENASTKNRFSQLQNTVFLKIKHKGKMEDLIIPERHTETVKSLKAMIKNSLGVAEEDGNWRLRRYNKTEDSLHEVYDIKENMDKTLEEIGLRQTCYMAIETKTSEEQFAEYDPKNIAVKLNVWRQNLTLLTETYLKPVKIGVREEDTFENFYHKVEKAVKIKDPIILKRNFSVGNPYQIFDMQNQKQKTLLSLRFFNGINLYVEEPTTGKLKWQKEFEDEKYKCQIRFNNPKVGLEKDNEIFIDTRKSLGELKQKISEIIGIAVDEFRIKKSQQAVSEMTAFKKRLVDLKFVNAEYLHIEEGKSSKGTIIIRKGILSLIDDQIDFSLGEEYQTDIESSSTTVADLKLKIAQKYGLFEFNIRIREFRSHQFGEIFRDSQNLLKIREKSLVWQELDIQDAKGVQVYLRVFDVMTLELGPVLSIFVEGSGNYEQLSLIIEEQTQIQADKILIHKPASTFIDRALLFECDWHETRFLQRPIREQPLFISCDGEFLIVKQAETAYHAKPAQRYQVYGGEKAGEAGSKGHKKQAGLKITVIEQKQMQILKQQPEEEKKEAKEDQSTA